MPVGATCSVRFLRSVCYRHGLQTDFTASIRLYFYPHQVDAGADQLSRPGATVPAYYMAPRGLALRLRLPDPASI